MNNKKIYSILALLKYFSKNNEILVQHRGIVFFNNKYFKELTWLTQYSPNKYSDLKIIINKKNLKWKIKEDELFFPIFPPMNSKYYNIYLKIIELTGFQINIYIYDEKSYENIKTNCCYINGFYFIGINDIFKDYIKQAKWKIKSYIESENYYDYIDLVGFIYNMGILYKFLLKFNDKFIFKKNIIIDFFKLIEKEFSNDKILIGIPGNLNIKNIYKGKVRFLDRNNLKIQKYYYNNFEEGDIIIANNTSVHFMDYILKCGGIITINNNRLSHASIVSRELGLPLILGLKDLFFKVFDGDLIEMNSLTGEIKILKRFWEN